MSLTGLDEATDAIAVVFRDRRDARAIARHALCASRVEWEKPLREIHKPSTPPGPQSCEECFRTWPCPTFRALGEFHKPPGPPKPIGYASWMEALREGWRNMTGVVLGGEGD